MAEVRQQMGGGPVYISFDIDGLDPAFAPGTGDGFFFFQNEYNELLTLSTPHQSCIQVLRL